MRGWEHRLLVYAPSVDDRRAIPVGGAGRIVSRTAKLPHKVGGPFGGVGQFGPDESFGNPGVSDTPTGL